MRMSRLLVALVLTSACEETASPRLPVAVVPPVIGVKCIGAPSLSPANATLAVGDTLRVATSLSFGCSTITAVDWTVSDATVATITPRAAEETSLLAVVTARRTGATIITARSVADPTISATMALTVSSP